MHESSKIKWVLFKESFCKIFQYYDILCLTDLPLQLSYRDTLFGNKNMEFTLKRLSRHDTHWFCSNSQNLILATCSFTGILSIFGPGDLWTHCYWLPVLLVILRAEASSTQNSSWFTWLWLIRHHMLFLFSVSTASTQTCQAFFKDGCDYYATGLPLLKLPLLCVCVQPCVL